MGNMKTLDLLVPHKTEPVTHIFHAYRPATDMLIGLWRKDDSVLDYAVPRAKNLYPGKGRNGNGQPLLTYLQCTIKTRKKRENN